MSRHRPCELSRPVMGLGAGGGGPSRRRRSRQRAGRRPAAPSRVSGAGERLAEAPADQDYAELCAQARALLEAGQPAAAAEVAQRALDVLPGGLDAARLRGLALLDAGETRQALSALRAALVRDPLDVAAQVGVAEAQEVLADAASAAGEWLRAWEIEPGIPQVAERWRAAQVAAGLAGGPATPPLTRAALARIYLRGSLFEHAVAEARAVLERDPDRTDAQLVLAEASWRSGDAAAAAATAATLLERLPDCAAANLLLAAHWQAIGKDPQPLLAQIQAVDPAGHIAARLFDDRVPPPLFLTQPLPPAPAALYPAQPFGAPAGEPPRPAREPSPGIAARGAISAEALLPPAEAAEKAPSVEATIEQPVARVSPEAGAAIPAAAGEAERAALVGELETSGQAAAAAWEQAAAPAEVVEPAGTRGSASEPSEAPPRGPVEEQPVAAHVAPVEEQPVAAHVAPVEAADAAEAGVAEEVAQAGVAEEVAQAGGPVELTPAAAHALAEPAEQVAAREQQWMLPPAEGAASLSAPPGATAEPSPTAVTAEVAVSGETAAAHTGAPEPAVAVAPASAEPSIAGLRVQGGEAMRDRRYLDAMRVYGQLVRALRAAGGDSGTTFAAPS